MNRFARSLGFAFVLLLVWTTLAPTASWAEDGEVRLYTNADLDRYPVLPVSDVQASRPTADEWRFVTDYLNRGYSRIEADRAYSLERKRAEAEVDLIRHQANRRSYGLPFYWNRFDRWNGVSNRQPGEGPIDRIKRAALPNGSIRPLHAGPTRAQIDYFKASHRSGADAFPSTSPTNRSGGGRKR